MSHRILVVAGSNEALRALPGQLENIEVKLIDSANEALWEVRTAPPEAIVADMDLPDMSALEMAEILPNFDVSTRVILWGRDENQGKQKEAEAAGVYRFLSGSVSIEELHTTIHQAISEPGAARPAAPEPEEAISVEPEPEPQPEPQPEPAAPPAASPPHVEPPARTSSERSTSTRGRLSSRAGLTSRRTVERPEQTTAPAAHEHHHHPRRHGTGTLVLTNDNLTPIRSIMSQLSQELGPQCIMLTDHAGMVLVDVGTMDNLPTMILLPLLTTSFSTAGEVARQLGEEDATTLYIHEGVNYDLYCFDITQRFLLVLVFNKKVASSKIGAVWVNTKRAIRELQDALS